MTILYLTVVASFLFASTSRLLVHRSNYCDAFPVDRIDSVSFHNSQYTIYSKDSSCKAYNGIDSIAFMDTPDDTFKLVYCDKTVHVYNGRADIVDIATNDSNADVKVLIKTTADKSLVNPVISVCGESSDGRLLVSSDIAYTLCLNGIKLSSSHAPAFNSNCKSAVNVRMAENTVNTFCDATKYTLDNDETANGSFNALGACTFSGKGQLSVEGNMKHAIYSKKSITIDDVTILVDSAKSDAIHSSKNVTVNGGQLILNGMQGDGIDTDDNFSMTGGKINLSITGEAAKGIKCGGIMNISDGNISATATGTLKNTNGDLSYCTILKCDSNMTITGGDFHLVNNSSGGKCISADLDLTIEGGTIYTETNGDGAQYINTDHELDYYTAKCISVGNNMYINKGVIQSKSTGIGGKGIIAEGILQIGNYESISNKDIYLDITTCGSSIINDTDEDSRFGCPKAIKCNSTIYILGGNILIKTHGMGGEGIESKDVCKIIDGTFDIHTYDDCFNVENDLTIDGGVFRLVSENNDGIDSNNTLNINGGIILSTSMHEKDESFDSADEGFTLYGGIVFGIGNGQDYVNEAYQPYYANKRTVVNGQATSGISLMPRKYLSLCNGDNVLMTMYNSNPYSAAYLMLTMPSLSSDRIYTLYESDEATANPTSNYFDGFFTTGGQLSSSATRVLDVAATTEGNNKF